MQHTWLCLQFINNVAQQVLAQGNTSNDRQLVKRSTCKRKQAIKVTKTMDIGLQKTMLMYQQKRTKIITNV